MDDEATQPATQQVLDPRRLGRNNSGLNEKDISDVLCLLHPSSPGAMRIVEEAAIDRPFHVLFRDQYDSFDYQSANIEEQETIIMPRPGTSSLPRIGNDIALRMSSPLLQPSVGFVFGRNGRSSDIVFFQDVGKRISNQHFRIYLNDDAILMLEDMSTNGTLVDDVLLKCKDPRFDKVRMLGSGSIIGIQNANEQEVIRFVIRIPSRASHMERFQVNFQQFLARCITDKTKLQTLQRLGKNRMNNATMKWDGGAKYNIIGLLGKGAFATVYQLATKMEGKLLAAKELEKRRFMKNGQLDKKIDNEMRIMESLRHPNIVEFFEYHDTGDYLYIIMEYVRHGDLQGLLNQEGRLKEADAQRVARQILSALYYLHKASITHRDIKPDNILIANLDPLEVKLSDFGLSKVVKQDETFLKTFCGTLLYCAPEVFPDFEGAPPKGTKRRRGARHFHSYSSSVDTWSFAAVLWYALCGKPPFEGIADATGRAMYTNIMTTVLDPAPLKEAGVSANCIDLLCRMLQIDPANRPTERQCLQHPWLDNGSTSFVLPVDPELQSIVEEDESEDDGEEQLSQLNLRGEIEESDEDFEKEVLEDEEFDRLVNARQTKKIRRDPLIPRNQLREVQDDSSADASFRSERIPVGDSDVGESFAPMAQSSGRPRLFGEIGQSAFQSSGILNARAHEALSHEASSGEARSSTSQAQVPALSEGRAPTPPIPQNQRGPNRMDGIISSPSLLGAESMVRELNMTSPQSPHSGVHSPNEPATPRTPDVPQHNSLESHSQLSEPTPKAKVPGFSRQISLPKTASFYYDPYDPSTHNLEYASKVSGIDFVGAAAATERADAQLPATMRVSTENPEASLDNGSSTSVEIPVAPVEPEIKPPPRRLGKLTATADSFAPNMTLILGKSRDSWGRLASNSLVYENAKDTRISKTAFVIFWWLSEGEDSEDVAELEKQGKDWTSLEGLQVGIFTCATSGISVNGKHLRMKDEKGRAQFGRLHSGDVIQVYHDAKGTECLKFKCDFYFGSGKEPRPPGEGFHVQLGNKLLSQ